MEANKIKHNKNHQWISDEYKTYGCSCEHTNGTPYSDEQWKSWYTNHKSSDETEEVNKYARYSNK